jgi:hypothetical protein
MRVGAAQGEVEVLVRDPRRGADAERCQHPRPHPRDQVGDVLGGRARQHHGELVAAEAGDQVAPAHLVLPGVRDLDEPVVARDVAAGVVELLELVEVEGGTPSRVSRCAKPARRRGRS